MNIDRAVVAFAGGFVLISVLLSVFHSPYWLWFTGFVGANLLQSAFTGFCPLAKILRALGVKPGAAFTDGAPTDRGSIARNAVTQEE